MPPVGPKDLKKHLIHVPSLEVKVSQLMLKVLYTYFCNAPCGSNRSIEASDQSTFPRGEGQSAN